MITIALYNLKGGVGKTASCVNFAYLAAADGFKTLLWDIDPQGSSSFYFKAKPKVHPGIKKLITKDADLENAILSSDFELLDVIPACDAPVDGTRSALHGILGEIEGDLTLLSDQLCGGYLNHALMARPLAGDLAQGGSR